MNADKALGAASGSVTINNGATLQTSGSFTFNASRSVSLSGSATIDTQGDTNTIAGTVSASAGTLVKQGSGTLILGNSVTMGGLSANAGTVQLAQSGSIGAITIGTSGTLALAAHTGGAWNVIDTSLLAFSGTTGSIDPGNNAMIAADLETKVALVQSNVNAAADLLGWDGQGITASAGLDELMAYENSQLYLDAYAGVGGLGLVNEITGNPIDLNEMLLKASYLGDMNGDGLVDGSDYGFQTPVYGVLNGGGSVVAQVAPAASAAPEAVPEPGVLGLLLAGASALLGLRRKGKASVR